MATQEQHVTRKMVHLVLTMPEEEFREFRKHAGEPGIAAVVAALKELTMAVIPDPVSVGEIMAKGPEVSEALLHALIVLRGVGVIQFEEMHLNG